MELFEALSFLALPSLVLSGVGCGGPIPGTSSCGYTPYGYGQPMPAPAPQIVAPAPTYQPYPIWYPQYQQVQYYYPAPATTQTTSNSYATAPPGPVEAFSKDTSVTIAAKPAASFEDYEKKLEELKPSTPVSTQDKVVQEIIANTSTLPPLTYVRELTSYPQGYLPRPLPYRPHPYIPAGCPILPPQYIRPIPYMPRGYVQPIPMPTMVGQTVSVPYGYSSSYALPPQPTVVQPSASVGSIYQRPFVIPPPINDCCGRCGAPCQYKSKVHALGMRTMNESLNLKPVGNSTTDSEFVPRRSNTKDDEPKDAKCSSEKLKDLMNKHTMRSTELTKRLIQKHAEMDLGGLFSVICSKQDFSYVARSDLFCQNEKNGIVCYAFQHY